MGWCRTMASLIRRRLITLSIDGKEPEEILQDGASCGLFILTGKNDERKCDVGDKRVSNAA